MGTLKRELKDLMRPVLRVEAEEVGAVGLGNREVGPPRSPC